MAVVQLRRYQFSEGTLAAWAVHWKENVLPLRQAFGFNVLFAYADPVNHQFVWAVTFDGTAEELTARDREYHNSPEWAARLKGKNGPILSTTISLVETVWPAGA